MAFLIWKNIPGYEGLYQVSNTGRVKTLARQWKSGRNLTRFLGESEKVQSPDKDGYPRVTLCKDGKKTRWRVHQLVCLAFLGPCPKGQQIRHLDHSTTNNNLANLCYGTVKENVADRHSNPRYVHPRLGAKLSDETKDKIRQSHLKRGRKEAAQ